MAAAYSLARAGWREITIVEGPERHVYGRRIPEFPCSATIRVLDPRLYRSVILRGNIGAAERFNSAIFTRNATW